MSNNFIKIETPYLINGMFVSSLDIPWEESGFALQGFIVTDKNINRLRAKCEWVIVSKSHSHDGIFKLEPNQSKHNKDDDAKDDDPFLVYLIKLSHLYDLYYHILDWFTDTKAENQKEAVIATVAERTQKLIVEPPKNEGAAYSRHEAVYNARIHRARGNFASDSLVTSEVVTHEVSTTLTEEVTFAAEAKGKLNTEAIGNLFNEVSNSEIMNVVLKETKESVNNIVESMIRNPDAMRLADDIKAYDNLSYKHAVDVSILMIAFGRELHLPKDVLVELGIGGLLHDIGEVKPPDGKDVRVRNIAMYQIYRSHVEDGLAAIKKGNHSSIVKAIIAQHHERYNGTGYPNGLRNDKKETEAGEASSPPAKKISMYGLMIAIVDTYVSMVAGRNTKERIAPSIAMAYITQRAGMEFDPALCDAFAQVIGVYPVGGYVELNTGEIAVVIKQNKIWRLKPTIQVILDADKKPTEPVTLDLMVHHGKSIKKEVVLQTKDESIIA
ncbi:MAG: HD domain-containing protein [Methylotenera sp.]|nr:HD domain-containing protein [Methylotenera sp.]